jgi:hypothetical protein
MIAEELRATSKHQQETHDKMFGGVDTTTRPHLVEEDSWTTAHNIMAINTNFQQVPPKVAIGTLTGPILALFTIPAGNNSSASIVALTPNGAYVVKINNGEATFEQMYLENFQVFDNKLNPVFGDTIWQ